MDTLLDILIHLLFSALIPYVLWKAYGDRKTKHLLWLFVIGIFSGLLIDLDHFIDYFIVFGAQFNIQDFLSGESFRASGKNYIFFHGIEFVLLIGVFLIKARKRTTQMFILTAFLAMLFHLLTDIFFFHIDARNYFFFYRILNNFNRFGS